MSLARGLNQLWQVERARLVQLQEREVETLTREAERLPVLLKGSTDLAADGLEACARLDAHLTQGLLEYASSLTRFTNTVDVLAGSSLTGLAYTPDPTASVRLFGALGFTEVCAAALELAPPLALAQLRSPRRVIQAHVALASWPLGLAVESAISEVSHVA